MKTIYIITVAGTIIGAAAGWLYWKYYGCITGCAITSKSLNSSLYGALLGFLFSNLVATTFIKSTDQQKTKTGKHDEQD